MHIRQTERNVLSRATARQISGGGESPLASELSSAADRLGATAFTAALIFIAFLVGAYVVLSKLPPYRVLKDAHTAGMALYRQATEFGSPLETDLFAPASTGDRGVTIHDPANAYQGYTLYTSGDEASAHLIDMAGNVVHKWHLPFSQVWDETSTVAKPRPDAYIYFRKAHVFPNGDLLALYIGVGDTPWGLGLVKMDKDSRVIWKFLERAHHDVEVGADGRIYTLTHAWRDHPLADTENLEPPFIEDFLVILSPEGRVERKISLLDALYRSPYRKFLYAVSSYALEDPLHANAVEPIEGAAATKFPYGNAGDVLVSLRELGLIGVVDPERGTVTWATKGAWVGQHDPDLLPDGNILLFDNVGSPDGDKRSRVIEFDPKNNQIHWQYDGTPNHRLHSVIRSAQQRLPNGNTLITESNGGRLLEVTRAGDIAWEFINPVRRGEHDEKIPIVSWAQRVEEGEFQPGFPSP